MQVCRRSIRQSSARPVRSAAIAARHPLLQQSFVWWEPAHSPPRLSTARGLGVVPLDVVEVLLDLVIMAVKPSLVVLCANDDSFLDCFSLHSLRCLLCGHLGPRLSLGRVFVFAFAATG